eukprot:10463553-Alexandrium_andersonii.AAC.1
MVVMLKRCLKACTASCPSCCVAQGMFWAASSSCARWFRRARTMSGDRNVLHGGQSLLDGRR